MSLNEEFVIVNPNRCQPWQYYKTLKQAEDILEHTKYKQLQEATNCILNHCKYGYGDTEPNYWLNQATRYIDDAMNFTIMPYPEFVALEREFLLTRDPIKEITEERYWEMLECLPPMNWGTHHGISSFFMSEMQTGTYTHQFATLNNKYYQKLVDIKDKTTWITIELIEGIQ